jgi:hypothetical protein
LPILPFDDFCFVPANDNAVDECIDLCFASVKRKTTWWWKNRQQFFWNADLNLASVASDHAIRPRRERQTGNQTAPPMLKDLRAQSAPMESRRAECRSKDGEQGHAEVLFIAVIHAGNTREPAQLWHSITLEELARHAH